MIVRIRVNVSLPKYAAGELYDVEATDDIRHLVEAGFADIVPFPSKVK